MPYETLAVEVDDRLAVVTIDRPDVRNALSRQVLAELRDVLAELRERDDVGIVAFTGAGEKAFVAGSPTRCSPRARWRCGWRRW
jgi:enoyl-CoA hydratase/carnithine racemase